MKIKKVVVYFTGFLSLTLMFALCYFLSYKSALRKFNELSVEQNKEIYLSAKDSTILLGEKEEDNKELEINDHENYSVEVGSMSSKVLLGASYTELHYDKNNNQIDTISSKAPSYLVGLGMKHIIDYYNDYMKQMDKEDYSKGLMSYELLQVAPDSVIVKKVYDSALWSKEKFIITLEDGYVVLKDIEQTRVFEITSIRKEDLRLSEIEELEDGIVIKNMEQYYSVLETLSESSRF